MQFYFLQHCLARERSEWKEDDAKRPLRSCSSVTSRISARPSVA